MGAAGGMPLTIVLGQPVTGVTIIGIIGLLVYLLPPRFFLMLVIVGLAAKMASTATHGATNVTCRSHNDRLLCDNRVLLL